MKKLTTTNEKTFFDKVTVGDIFTYSMTYSYDQVKSIAEKCGYSISYARPKSDLYKAYGSQIFVISKKYSKREMEKAEESSVNIRCREFLNTDEIYTSSIAFSIENFFEEKRLSEINADLEIRDCDRKINLEFSIYKFDDPVNNIKGRLAKLEVLKTTILKFEENYLKAIKEFKEKTENNA